MIVIDEQMKDNVFLQSVYGGDKFSVFINFKESSFAMYD